MVLNSSCVTVICCLQDVADACRTGPATDIIFGLALGYKSCIIPCFVMAVTIYIANSLAGMLGIACSALGMLTTLSTGLAIDAYGPISDNAGGIAEMAGMGEWLRCCVVTRQLLLVSG
jgi:inorganic pyrophosphatase